MFLSTDNSRRHIYVVLSVYAGVLHIFVGLFIGLYTVWKAHGAAAAFFEKGSWLLIMTEELCKLETWSWDSTNYLSSKFGRSSWRLPRITSHRIMVYEKFGWVGGLVMGLIEIFNVGKHSVISQNNGVGVAGVKIAEISINMGWEKIGPAMDAGDYLGLLWHRAVCLVQLFAIARNPSDHTRRPSTLCEGWVSSTTAVVHLPPAAEPSWR